MLLPDYSPTAYPDFDIDKRTMKHRMMIPSVYPLMPAEMPVEVLSEDGIVNAIDATVNHLLIRFVKNPDGQFETTSANEIEKPYLAYLTRLINRKFGN